MRYFVTIMTETGLQVIAETAAEPAQSYEDEKGSWHSYNDPREVARSAAEHMGGNSACTIMTDEMLLAEPGGVDAMARWRAGDDDAFETAMWTEAERAMDADLRLMIGDSGDPEAERLLDEGAGWGEKARYVLGTRHG